jgi:hypothetical protein
VLLTITTTRAPATDLGYLLHKHYGYQARFLPVGPEDPADGPPTQLAVFAREAEEAEPWS